MFIIFLGMFILLSVSALVRDFCIFAFTSADANSRQQETEWKEKAKVELEEWHARQNEQLEKTKTNNRYCSPGRLETGWKINKKWKKTVGICELSRLKKNVDLSVVAGEEMMAIRSLNFCILE